jgi:sulfur carrier protein
MRTARFRLQFWETLLIFISLNGQSREVPENLDLQSLLEWLNLPADRVAVERNLEIVPRRLWAATTIRAGDRIEVVHFVGGGLDLFSNRKSGRGRACPTPTAPPAMTIATRPLLVRQHVPDLSGVHALGIQLQRQLQFRFGLARIVQLCVGQAQVIVQFGVLRRLAGGI